MAFRVDLGVLRPAQRMPDGRVRVEAHITRAGVFQYLNHDGTIRRELREPREVFDATSMRSFEQLPVTNTHPYEPVSSRNARQFMVGANDSSVARDDDHMKTMIMVADEQTIKEMESGDKVQVSCGYTCDFDPTPGVHPVYGAYDGKQKNIRGNHIALVTHARAGQTARVRMDAAMRKDYAVMATANPVLTSVEEGHQHAVDLSSEWSDGTTGETSWATAEGYDSGHSHTWIRNSDGSVTLSVNEGHTHTVAGLTVELDAPKNDSAKPTNNRSPSRAKENRMPDDKTALTKATELLAQEKQRADSADSLVAQLKKQLLEVEARADAAEGALTVAREKLVEADRYKLDQVKFDEQNAAIVKLTNDLNVAIKAREDAENPERLAKAVEVRCDILDRAGPILGPKVAIRHMSDQDIMIMTIDKTGKALDVEEKKKPEHVRARFLERTDNFAACESAMASVRIAATPPAGQRADTAADARARMEERNRNSWRSPAPK